MNSIEPISLFGGLVCSLSNLEETSGGDWLLLAATVGTNKLFHFDIETKTLCEVSRNADSQLPHVDVYSEFDSAAQCGLGVPNPNLGNLKLYFRKCALIWFVSTLTKIILDSADLVNH